MSTKNKKPWVKLENLKKYLGEINELELLAYVKESGDGFSLDEQKFSQVTLTSTFIQIATIFAVLGEFDTANKVHKIDWETLSPSGDKVANGILKEFIQPWLNR